MKVIIVGAGAIGMMQARDLALKGVDVTVLERQEAGREASWAGGGIVSPLYPWRYNNAVSTLARWSQSYYPNLCESLEAESGVDPELSRHGLLVLDLEDRDAALKWALEQKAWLKSIDKEAVYELEPHLREGVDGGLWMSHVASVRNPRLLTALKGSLAQLNNVEVMTQAEVERFITHDKLVKGVRLLNGNELYADAVIVCAGSWSSQLIGSENIEVKPVKGQIILFRAEKGMVNRVVLDKGRYVIPRRDGSILAGSTLEYTGYDKSVTQSAKDLLSDVAINLFPELAQCQILHHWAGLRPAAPEGIPYIGAVSAYDNLYVNAGHFRNGLVLAPASVALTTALVCKEETPFDAKPYDPAARAT